MRKPKDVRSTGRKRGRAVLFRSLRPYRCDICKRTSTKPPPEIRRREFLEFNWPEENRVLNYSLQVNHINKILIDNDPANLQWLCARCHKLLDGLTEAGESIKGDEHGIGLDFL